MAPKRSSEANEASVKKFRVGDYVNVHEAAGHSLLGRIAAESWGGMFDVELTDGNSEAYALKVSLSPELLTRRSAASPSPSSLLSRGHGHKSPASPEAATAPSNTSKPTKSVAAQDPTPALESQQIKATARLRFGGAATSETHNGGPGFTTPVGPGVHHGKNWLATSGERASTFSSKKAPAAAPIDSEDTETPLDSPPPDANSESSSPPSHNKWRLFVVCLALLAAAVAFFSTSMNTSSLPNTQSSLASPPDLAPPLTSGEAPSPLATSDDPLDDTSPVVMLSEESEPTTTSSDTSSIISISLSVDGNSMDAPVLEPSPEVTAPLETEPEVPPPSSKDPPSGIGWFSSWFGSLIQDEKDGTSDSPADPETPSSLSFDEEAATDAAAEADPAGKVASAHKARQMSHLMANRAAAAVAAGATTTTPTAATATTFQHAPIEPSASKADTITISMTFDTTQEAEDEDHHDEATVGEAIAAATKAAAKATPEAPPPPTTTTGATKAARLGEEAAVLEAQAIKSLRNTAVATAAASAAEAASAAVASAQDRSLLASKAALKYSKDKGACAAGGGVDCEAGREKFLSDLEREAVGALESAVRKASASAAEAAAATHRREEMERVVEKLEDAAATRRWAQKEIG